MSKKHNHEAPERIWLQVCDEAGCVLPFDQHCDVSWCDDEIGCAHEVEYVRADKFTAALDELRDKALRFDLDQAGIDRRDRDAVELVELRAENARLLDARTDLWTGIEERVHSWLHEDKNASDPIDTFKLVGDALHSLSILRAENERLQKCAATPSDELHADDAVATGMYANRCDDVLKLHEALRAVYALTGEDAAIAKICTDAIRETGGGD